MYVHKDIKSKSFFLFLFFVKYKSLEKEVKLGGQMIEEENTAIYHKEVVEEEGKKKQ